MSQMYCHIDNPYLLHGHVLNTVQAFNVYMGIGFEIKFCKSTILSRYIVMFDTESGVCPEKKHGSTKRLIAST